MRHLPTINGQCCPDCRQRYLTRRRAEARRWRQRHPRTAPDPAVQRWRERRAAEADNPAVRAKSRTPWTTTEIAVALDPALSISDKIRLTGRTYEAIAQQRRRQRNTPQQ